MPTITVIGGGPAGAAAAFVLAAAHCDVLLIEQHPFPRDKVCGECLSALGIDVLQRLGLRDRIAQARPALLNHAALHAPDGSSLRLPLPGTMWGLSRLKLDALLLQAARDAGAVIRQPARCEAILPGNPPRLVVRDLLSNAVETHTSDWILLADGKNALPDGTPPATGDFGIKAHFTDAQMANDGIELFGVPGNYGGITAIEDAQFNAAFSVPQRQIQAFAGNFDALLAQMLRQNRALANCLSPARRVSPWLAAPLPRFGVAPVWPAGVIPLGNAAAALEPIGGEGMGLALRSAELAAAAILHATSVESLRRDFERLWQMRRFACRAAAWIVSHPALSGPALDFAAASDRLAAAALRWIGKAAPAN